MIHFLSLVKEPFELISHEEKVIEMRLFDEKRKKIRIGDYIIFTYEDKHILVKITSLQIFHDFKELYAFYPKSHLGYKMNEEASYKDMYRYYNDEQIEKYGTLAIGIKLIKEVEIKDISTSSLTFIYEGKEYVRTFEEFEAHL